MGIKTIIGHLKDDTISVEDALQKLTEVGYCPNIFNDDNGHWAVSFDGFKPMMISGTSDVAIELYLKKKYWKKSIRKALIYSLKH